MICSVTRSGQMESASRWEAVYQALRDVELITVDIDWEARVHDRVPRGVTPPTLPPGIRVGAP
jgi:hypothetical protein